MAKNDRFLLDGIVDDRVAARSPSDKRDEAFEYLAFEQVMKDFDLSNDELLSGWIDGRQDGGIDGFFILVNGHLLQDPEAFIWPRTGSDLRVFLISCKHHETFKQATLDAIVATLTELLDFGIEDASLQGAYSEALLRKRNNLRYAYRKLSPRLSSFSIDISYASRGDTLDIGTEVRSRADQLRALVKDYFGSCKSHFTFVGSTELVGLHRKIPNFTLELPFVEALAKGERYVVLVRLSDYFKFVSDEDGKLRRYLFESNVRDFMGLNRVNEDIRSTLENKESPDFWWLNNGVTILATSASITGKSIQASEIQIVNGLQTTESIYRYLSSSGSATDDRCVLVKVIVTRDEAVRDAIIRATNNQTDVELASLHATDKIQRDIEDALSRSGLSYERRKNYYVNLGHTPAEIVTPLYAAAGYIALVLKMPERAASLRSKFMRSSTSYETVFSSKVPLEVWPKIAHILKLVDTQLEVLRPRGKGTEKFLKGWRYMIALLLVSKSFGKFTFSANDLVSYDTSFITATSVRDIWDELNQTAPWDRIGSAWTSPKNVVAACTKFAAARGISGIEMLLARSPNLFESPTPSKPSTPISDDLLNRLREVMPPQPWKPGLHRTISRELGCDVSTYFSAVERLIEEGVFYHQKDGVLYDVDGNVVSFDPDRVDPETLALISDAQPINPPDAAR
ncbi:AIPR family protein [Acidithiobacillus sp.]|uniref:AIPR family protein n=1 Tax=Acidithiobacillus sp. TaxID=1872118 RepID=UPI00231B5ED4|nr:AIPR family protein [Acidithiobacillus sp.]MDA8245998.1 AIPR family protein [Acidithiobacillus sp.]